VIQVFSCRYLYQEDDFKWVFKTGVIQPLIIAAHAIYPIAKIKGIFAWLAVVEISMAL
jgi:hypothetical protein